MFNLRTKLIGVLHMVDHTTKKGQKYTHLTIEEREEIAVGLARGLHQKIIAKNLKRSPATISREISRNQPEKNNVEYRANQSHKRYEFRKKLSHQRERIPSKRLRNYIIKKLKLAWSPELIAGRIKLDQKYSISHETIYQWIYQDRRDLIQYLRFKHKRRKNRASGKNKRQTKIPNRVSITKRPKYILKRKQSGHWEADTAVSRESKGAIMGVVERVSRFLAAKKLTAKTATNMDRSLVQRLKKYPSKLLSITYDNGSENVLHIKTNKKLNTKSYFCEPYHSWEKGSIENRIGQIRRFFPKKTDWNSVTQIELNRVVNLINNRPMKCLKFKTPAEVFCIKSEN